MTVKNIFQCQGNTDEDDDDRLILKKSCFASNNFSVIAYEDDGASMVYLSRKQLKRLRRVIDELLI